MEADIISNTIKDFIKGFFISPPTTVRPRQVRLDAAARSQELTWRQHNKRRKSYTILAGLRYRDAVTELHVPALIPISLPIYPCFIPSLPVSLHFRRIPYIPSPHVKWDETQNVLLKPLQSKAGSNPPGKARTSTHTQTHALWLRCTHMTHGNITIYVCDARDD